MAHLLEITGNEAEVQQGYYSVECTPEKWPSVYLQISNYWLEVAPEHYVIDASNNRDGSACILGFTGHSAPFFLYGDALFRGYYTIHDDYNDRIGFVPQSESSKSRPQFAKYPPTNSISRSFWQRY